MHGVPGQREGYRGGCAGGGRGGALDSGAAIEVAGNRDIPGESAETPGKQPVDACQPNWYGPAIIQGWHPGRSRRDHRPALRVLPLTVEMEI